MDMVVIFPESRAGIWTESKYRHVNSEGTVLIFVIRAKYLRQTLVFADFLTPEFNALFNKYMKNVAGKLKIKRTYEEGSILDVIPQVQQVRRALPNGWMCVFIITLIELYSYRCSLLENHQRCAIQVLY